MTETSDKTLRDCAGEFLVDFPILDNSIASLFSSVFGARTNSVEVFYANISMQNRLDCIQAFCHQDAFPFDSKFKEEIESIVAGTRKVQTFRNLLAHNFILNTDILVRGKIAEQLKGHVDPSRFFVWKTNKKGKYEVKPISRREIEVTSQSVVELSLRISVLCATIRVKYGLRP